MGISSDTVKEIAPLIDSSVTEFRTGKKNIHNEGGQMCISSDTVKEIAPLIDSSVTECRTGKQNIHNEGGQMGISSDTVKEIAPLIDSSVTECRNSKQNIHNEASSRGELNEEVCHSGAEHQPDFLDGIASEMKKAKLNNTRYFIIKSLNHQNIQLSIKKGIWATQVMNEPILEEAFLNSGRVILIFSVNMSGFFQGYAQMMSSVSWGRDDIWSKGSGKSNPWGRSFKVKWLCLGDLPFQNTLHLKNPWNDYKPVKISRDCQELPRDIGEALCELLDQGNKMFSLNGDQVSGDDFPKRRNYLELFQSRQDEDFNLAQEQMAPMLYPSLLYQHQSEASRFHFPYQGSSLLNKSSIVSGTSNVKQSKHYPTNGSTASSMNNTSQFDSLGFSAELSPFDGTLTEEDILEMSYEEYLEAYARGSRKLHYSAAGPAASFQKSSSSKELSDDSHSASSSKKRTYHQTQV